VYVKTDPLMLLHAEFFYFLFLKKFEKTMYIRTKSNPVVSNSVARFTLAVLYISLAHMFTFSSQLLPNQLLGSAELMIQIQMSRDIAIRGFA
jgi:hypothetical protein